MIVLHLPLPPSLNELYPGKVRRHKSKKYEDWIHKAGYMLNSQHVPSIKGLVQVHYIFGKPRNKDGKATGRAMDVFNREKAISDLLVQHGIIEDDSLIQRGIVEWADIDGVDIEIQPYIRTGCYCGQTSNPHTLHP